MGSPISSLAGWSPFRLDALGLVTLIGAEEVATAIGALQRNWITEYLPLLGSFLVAEDKVTTPLPGFTLYNASHGIYVPVLSGWFSRWLIANLDKNSKGGTLFTWSVRGNQRAMAAEVLAVTIGIVANGGLITVAALQGDSYGIANAAAMAVSALARRLMMSKKRRSLDSLVGNMQDRPQHGDSVAILITTPDANAAVFRFSRDFIRLIVTDLDPASRYMRAISWIAFAVHVICIGQAYLLSQLLSVGLLATATVLTIFHVGANRNVAGTWLHIERSKVNKRRRDALLSLELSAKEERILRNYWQLPHRPHEVEQQAAASEFWTEWDSHVLSHRSKRPHAGAAQTQEVV